MSKKKKNINIIACLLEAKMAFGTIVMNTVGREREKKWHEIQQ